MAVKFIVDSGSDLLPTECEPQGIVHLPLKVMFGTREYRDGVDMSHREFYEHLVESDVLPTTSQVSPAEFGDAMEQIISEGDDAVVITVSSKLSGTYQSAMIAASDYPGRVFVVDSLSVSLGQRILVQFGLRLRNSGMSAEEIADALEVERHKIRVMALVDTLEYLKKGGRISAATALAGSLLSIKPVIALEGGSKQGNNLLRQMVEKCGGIDFTRPFCVAYSGLSDTMMNKYIIDSAELFRGHESSIQTATVGCAIGTHAGPGAVAVAFYQN